VTTLILGDYLEKMYSQKVKPVLLARGIPSTEAPLQIIAHSIARDQNFWTIQIQRPIPGLVCSVRFRPNNRPKINDCTVNVRGLPKNFQGELSVSVRHVFGITADCEKIENKSLTKNATETKTLLVMTGKDFTLVMDILPGKDCWVAVAIWPNETLPIDILLQRPEKMWSPAKPAIKHLTVNKNDFSFASICPICDASGALDCEKCIATGRLPCRRCENIGEIRCPKCDGSGIYQKCKRCNGTGEFIGRKGDVMGECRSCNGSGQLDCNICSGNGKLECRNCSGSGSVDCRPCEGTGSVSCFRCHGTSYLPVKFSHIDGLFTGSERDDDGNIHYPVIPPKKVSVINHKSGEILQVAEGATAMLERIFEATKNNIACDPRLEAEIENHCQQFKAIEGCLYRAMEANDIRETQLIEIGRPEPSTRRSRNGVVYDFPVIRWAGKKYVQEGKVPFPEDSQVLLCAGDRKNAIPIQLPRQGDGPLNKDLPVSLIGCSGNLKNYRLEIRFPHQLDLKRLPENLVLKLDAPPPPEKTQLKHLLKWCGRENRDHPILRSLFAKTRLRQSIQPQRLFNNRVAEFPRQVDAVSLALSPGPLALIKGPPGTGKTTIITEIVRQAAARDQKILICSQTHQAVLNVLERLHKEGGIRMVRHGREEKLTDLEKTYLVGGVEDAFFQKVISRTREALHLAGVKGDAYSRLLKILPDAKNASVRLMEIRAFLEQELKKYNEKADQDLNRAGDILAQALAEAEKTERTKTEDIVLRRKKAEKELKVITNRILKADRNKDTAFNQFRARTKRDPEIVASEPGVGRWFRDTFIPNWLVGDNTIQERYSQAMLQLADLKPCEKLAHSQIIKLDEEEKAVREFKAISIARFRDTFATTKANIENRRLEECNKARDFVKSEETRLRSIQSEAVACSFGLRDGLSDDSTPEIWENAHSQIKDASVENSRRCSFLSEWIRDIETEPGEITACYWNHLQVFFSTCVGVGSFRRLVERGRDAVDLVIIDEAAHATASETLIPLLYGKKAILIGDEMQLPPVMPANIGECDNECSRLIRMAIPVADEPARGIAGEVRMTPCWLGCSYFEWIWRARPNVPRTMLDTQFRMHPLIADFVGSVFYPEGLLTGVSSRERELGFGEFSRPICLISTSHYENRHEEFLEPGYRNELEAGIVRRIIEKAEAELGTLTEFGVITPYKEQKDLINRKLADLLPDLRKVHLKSEDVASVDSFQGSERDVILISFARSPKKCDSCQGTGKKGPGKCERCNGKGWRGTGLTFARDLRRLNVAFSRPRKMLILIGDIEALTNSRYRGGSPGGKVLELFKTYVADHGKVLHLWERNREND